MDLIITTATHVNDDVMTPNNADYYLVTGGGVIGYQIINYMSKRKLFRIQEHCVKHASK